MRRILLVLTLLVALLAMPLVAFAQDASTMPPVACGNLSDEDCTFLEDSKVANQQLATYDSVVGIDFSLTDIPDLPSDIGVSVMSQGSFSVNPELSAAMLELQANPPADPAEMVQAVMDASLAFYGDTQADMIWDIGLSEQVASLLSQQAGVTIPTELNLPLRLVDGFLYANVDDLASIVPGLSGWLGVDVLGALEANMGQSMAAIEEGMSSMDPAAMGAMLSGSTAMNPELQAAVNDNIYVERLDDSVIDGVDVAQFVWSFDLGGFISDPAVIDMIVTQAGAQMAMQSEMEGSAPPMTAEDLNMIADMLPMLAPMLLSGIQWDTTASIGIEDLYVYTTETNIAWDLGSMISMVGAMSGDPAAGAVKGSPDFSLNVSAANSNFDGEVDIVAPEDAMIVPLDEMQ